MFLSHGRVGSILFDELSGDDKKLRIQLLKNEKVTHAKIALQVKNDGFEEGFQDEKKQIE